MGRSPCCEKAHTNKGAWTKDEDQRLIDYIRLHGEGCWRSLPKAAGNIIASYNQPQPQPQPQPHVCLDAAKSCRLRWINYLRPDLKRGNFTQEEDELIIKLHSLLGNKWSLIAGRLPGRTDNEIKNYWNTHIKRKLISRGLDPQTHRPLNSNGNTVVSGDKAPENLGFTVVNNPPLITQFGGISQTIDFKKNHPDAKVKSDSCNSGTTTDDGQMGRLSGQLHKAQDDINLELSIGLSQFQGEARSSTASSAESRDVGPRPGPFEVKKGHEGGQNGKVCLCCQLGFEINGQGQGGCSNCQTKGGYFYSRYIGPLGS